MVETETWVSPPEVFLMLDYELELEQVLRKHTGKHAFYDDVPWILGKLGKIE